MENKYTDFKHIKAPNARLRKELIFYSCMMIIPVIQVIIFYFVVNFNSILLSLQEYSYGIDGGKAGYFFVGFKNFKQSFENLATLFELRSSLKNSFLAFGLQVLIMPWISMLFSYYIYKKRFGGKLFNIFLFLPSIISPLVITLIYKVMLEDAVPGYIQLIFGKSVNPIYSSNKLVSLLVYYFFTSFGTSVLLYSGAMSAIDQSIMEAADIDGATGMKGFIYVVFPLIYPTFVTFIVVGVAAIFTNQLNLYSFERGAADPDLYTYGYYLYTKTQLGTASDYPQLAALGIIFTLIAVPLTFGTRYLLVKIGPSDK